MSIFFIQTIIYKKDYRVEQNVRNSNAKAKDIRRDQVTKRKHQSLLKKNDT